MSVMCQMQRRRQQADTGREDADVEIQHRAASRGSNDQLSDQAAQSNGIVPSSILSVGGLAQ